MDFMFTGGVYVPAMLSHIKKALAVSSLLEGWCDNRMIIIIILVYHSNHSKAFSRRQRSVKFPTVAITDIGKSICPIESWQSLRLISIVINYVPTSSLTFTHYHAKEINIYSLCINIMSGPSRHVSYFWDGFVVSLGNCKVAKSLPAFAWGLESRFRNPFFQFQR